MQSLSVCFNYWWVGDGIALHLLNYENRSIRDSLSKKIHPEFFLQAGLVAQFGFLPNCQESHALHAIPVALQAFESRKFSRTDNFVFKF